KTSPNINLVNLKFIGSDSYLEALFQDRYFHKNITHVRNCHFLTICFYLLAGLVDYFLFPNNLFWLFSIRFLIVVPIFLLGYFFTFSPQYKKFWHEISFFYILLTGVSFLIFIVIADPPRSYDYYVGVLVCMIFGYTFIRTKFILASIAGFILITAYLFIAVLIIEIPTQTLFNSLFYLFLFNFLGMLISRHIEISARNDFYLEYKLSNEQNKVIKLNNKLEHRVAERTRDLELSNRNLKIKIDDLHQSESERHKLEEQLRQTYKMEAIGTLAGGIAHDFNNILTGIFGYSRLVEMNLEEHNKAKKYLARLDQSAQRASALVQQILTFSRQAEQQKISITPHLILKEALKLLRSSIPSSIEIKKEIFSKAAIIADPIQIHQVIMNLCTNAYQAMSDTGGVMAIGLHEIEISGHENFYNPDMLSGKYLKLEISDTGHGIDKKILERIFDPYFTTKGLGKGTGLGLSMVDGIVKKSNGFINVHSIAGEGSVFKIFWPISEHQDQGNSDVSKKKETRQFRGTERIMLVDDETAILEPLQIILSKQGYHITTFTEGLSALKAFKKDPEQFDLVITDMTMPQMTGDKLSIEMLKIRENIPIILCTGYSEKTSDKEICKLGIRKYLQKPITAEELSASIQEVLYSKSQ
ncbi:MAG: hypothetical protein DRH93_11560, partial [Deltaproteobacteria bacterium]